MKKTIIALSSLGLEICAWAGVDPLFLDVFPPSTARNSSAKARTTITHRYYPSGSSWTEGIFEDKVFLAEVKSQQTPLNSFAFRIGKGGQVYSLRGEFGESVPPSRLFSPWNDEVWQFVCVCTKYNGFDRIFPPRVQEQLRGKGYQTTYFIHDSGAYIYDRSGPKQFYCPLFAYQELPKEGCVRTLNWGMVPQLRTTNRSTILYYTQFKNLGDGVIELTWVVHNFSARGDIVYDYLNAPWGGTRLSRLPYHYLSLKDGSLIDRAEMAQRKIRNGIKVRDTGGWNISSQFTYPRSPSLALVFGRDKHWEKQLAAKNRHEPFFQKAQSIYQDWDASGSGYGFVEQDWETRPENTWRNYEVAFIVPFFNLTPQTTIWYRSYLVVGGREETMEKARELVEHVDYGVLTFPREKSPLVYLRCGETSVSCGDRPAADAVRLYARPVSGAIPLFLVKEKRTGRCVVTTDLYCFTGREKLNLDLPADEKWAYWRQAVGYDLSKEETEWKGLLGYALREKPSRGAFRRLSEMLPKGLQLPFGEFNLDLWVPVGEENR